MENNTPKKDGNIALKIISIFIAMIVWISVFNLADSIITSRQTVSLGVINQDVLEKANLSYTLSQTDGISVEYKVRTKDSTRIQKTDFNVFVDLSDYSITGSVPVYVEVLNGKDSLIQDLTIEPSVIKVTTEEIQTKQFKLEIETTGELKDSYELNTITLDKNSVNITGPKSQIGRISKAKVNIDIDKLAGHSNGVATITYVDSNNNVIKFDAKNKLTADISNTPYEIKVYKNKEVDLIATVSGKPAEGSIYTSLSIIPSKVKISGDPETVDKVKSINLGILNISGRSASYTEEINVNDRIDTEISVVEDDPYVSVYITLAEIDIEVPTQASQEIEETQETQENETESSTEEIDYNSSEYGPGMETTLESTESKAEIDIITGESSSGEIIDGE